MLLKQDTELYNFSAYVPSPWIKYSIQSSSKLTFPKNLEMKFFNVFYYAVFGCFRKSVKVSIVYLQGIFLGLRNTVCSYFQLLALFTFCLIIVVIFDYKLFPSNTHLNPPLHSCRKNCKIYKNAPVFRGFPKISEFITRKFLNIILGSSEAFQTFQSHRRLSKYNQGHRWLPETVLGGFPNTISVGS